jgi:hypothetical protein
MKIELFILLISVVFYSCDQKTKSSTEITETEVSAISQRSSISNEFAPTTQSEIKDQEPSGEDFTLHPFDITQLPNNWIRLTETDTVTIIYYSCDGGNMLITLNPEDSSILFHGQQEDIKYEYTRFGISEDSVIHFIVQESNDLNTFALTRIEGKPGITKWDLTNYYLGNELHEELFVSKEHENDFVSIEQPCIECWDEEFCDEIESKNNKNSP